MQQTELIPHLFRTEYRKIVSVLSKLFGIEHIEIAEDIVSDTFLLATELWGLKGLPENPTAWLYAVAKNKAKNIITRNHIFYSTIAPQVRSSSKESEAIDYALSNAQKDSFITIISDVVPDALEQVKNMKEKEGSIF